MERENKVKVMRFKNYPAGADEIMGSNRAWCTLGLSKWDTASCLAYQKYDVSCCVLFFFNSVTKHLQGFGAASVPRFPSVFVLEVTQTQPGSWNVLFMSMWRLHLATETTTGLNAWRGFVSIPCPFVLACIFLFFILRLHSVNNTWMSSFPPPPSSPLLLPCSNYWTHLP